MRFLYVWYPEPKMTLPGMHVLCICPSMLIKAVINSAYTNTRSSSTVIHMNLTNLDWYMEALEQNDIMRFNEYIKAQIKLLAAAGETTSDLLMNLFKAY